MKIVLLSGCRGSGKDAAAQALVEKAGFRRLAFADALKDLVSKAYHFPRAWLDDRKYKEQPLVWLPVQSKDGFSSHVNEFMQKEHFFHEKSGVRYHTPRSLAILEGSVKRSVDPNFWVGEVARKMQSFVAPRPPAQLCFVVSDWRYCSEFWGLKELLPNASLTTVRINRFETCESTDPSERDLDRFAFQHVVENRASLEVFRNAILEVVK